MFQARILERVAISFSRGSSRPRDRTHVYCISHTGGGFFTTAPPGTPLMYIVLYVNYIWIKLRKKWKKFKWRGKNDTSLFSLDYSSLSLLLPLFLWVSTGTYWDGWSWMKLCPLLQDLTETQAVLTFNTSAGESFPINFPSKPSAFNYRVNTRFLS